MNKIYKTIWNKTLGAWVVTSELGRGKIKSSTSKTLVMIGLGCSLISSPAFSAPNCDQSTLTCNLINNWDLNLVNSGGETLFINDGKNYSVTGPATIATTTTGNISITADDAIEQGYITNTAEKVNGKPLISFDSKNNVIVTTGASGVTATTNTYNSNRISQTLRNPMYKILNPALTSAPYYYQASFVKVTDGEATINAIVPNISGSFKDTQLASAVSTTTDATVIWSSNNSITQGASVGSAEQQSSTISFHIYSNSITAFDGSTIAIRDLAGLKSYNNWLINEIKSGRLAGSSYDVELNKAYNTGSVTYLVNPIPANTVVSDPILTADIGTFAPLYANGSKATAILTGSLTGKVNSSSEALLNNALVLLENSSTGINKGRISSWGFGYGVIVKSGSTFINQGLIDNNNSSITTYLTRIDGENSHYINDSQGIINLSPNRSYAIDLSFGFRLYSLGKITNKGVINFSDASHTSPGKVIGISADNSIVDNQGTITLGRTADGTPVNTSVDSMIINLTHANGVTNSGQLILGEKTEGTTAVRITSTVGNANFTNSGTIDILGEKSETAASNTGIYVSGKANGIDNSGTINVKGTNNIGMSIYNGAQVSSSGNINVIGKQTTSKLNNFGVWVEGSGATANITGAVNLTGDNAIAVHAKNKGTVNLSGNGQVNFSSGDNQIGYYIYGASSKINNTSSGTQDVTTNNSTLMRLDGGASFTGSSTATSTMSASGHNSTVIVATGKGTSVNSGGMGVNVNGKNAIGFLVEGGATGTLDPTATINLTGEGAIAGIADGNGHDLSGNQKVITNAEKKNTSLTAGAALASSQDDVVGYIARNLATLTNAGNITFSGNNATGIEVAEGATGKNSGNITLLGQGSVGLKTTANTLATSLNSTGSLILQGDWDGANDATRTTGILASGSQSAVTIGNGTTAANVNLTGAGSVGVHATNGSLVILNDKVAINFDSNNADQIAFWVDGVSSRINTSSGSTVTNVSGDGATLFYVNNQAALEGTLNLNLEGKAGSEKITAGVRVNGAGSQATLTAGSQLTIGTNATGLLVENEGQAVISSGSVFNISGDNAMVAKATGENSLVENGAVVTTQTGNTGLTAFLAENGGTINNKNNINLSIGTNHTAIDLNNGHLVNTGNVQANGTAIHIKGENSTISNISNSGAIEAVDGKATIHIDEGAGLSLSAISGSSGTIKASGTADGILLSDGALSLNVANTIIDMSDASASGIGIHNVAGIEGISLDNTHIKLGGTGIGIKTGASLANNNSGQIDVTDGTGILYLNEDSSAVAADLDFSDSADLVINVSGQGVGVKATLDGQNRAVNTGTSVNVLSTAGGSAIDVANVKTVTNSGKLTSQSTVLGGNVLNVHDAETINNSGIIKATLNSLTAIAMSNAGNKTLTNTGDITGALDFATGDNTINLTGGTVSGAIKADGGANTLTALAGSVHTGEISLTGAKTQTVVVQDASTVGNMTLGDGANQVTVNNATTNNIITGDGNSTLTLSGTAAASNITLGSGNNTVTLSDSAQIANLVAGMNGNNTVVVKGGATFDSLDAGTGGSADSLTFDGVNYTLANTLDIQHFDLLNLANGSNFTTAQVMQMGDSASSAGHIAIDEDSSLVFTATSAYTLNHTLLGTGLVDVQSGATFDFGADVGNQFAGTVQMDSTNFALSGLNTNALTKAILSVMSNNTTTVGSGVQQIGGLTFNGGLVDFGVNLPKDFLATNSIKADKLDASGTGHVKIKNSFENDTPPIPSKERGLLDQQTDTLVKLVEATTVAGSAGNLVLIDENGNTISNTVGTKIYQNGAHAADGYYDYRLTTRDNSGQANGLYVGYGLTQLDLLTSGANELVINTAYSTEKVLSAKVTGSGDLGFVAGNGADSLVLSNLHNSYTGVTDIQSGTVKLGTNNGFGATSKLILANTTTADINGKTQIVGALDAKQGSTLNLNSGNLTLNNGGESTGELIGSGDLTLDGGTLTITKANANLSATTTVNTSAEVQLKNVLALGTGNVVANGHITLDNASGAFDNKVSGSGKLNSYNGSEITLHGNNTSFTGVIDIDTSSTLTVGETKHVGGTISINNANQFIANNNAAMTLEAVVNGTGDLIKTNTGTLTLTGTNIYTGNTDIKGGVVAISTDSNLGSTTNQTKLNGGNLQITADLTSARDVTLVNNGTVIVDGGVVAAMSGWNDQTSGIGTITKNGDGTLIWTGNNSANAATVSVTNGTLQVESLNNLASANGDVNLGSGGILSILKTSTNAASTDFTRKLSGGGELLVDLGNKSQELTLNVSSAGGDFSGQVTMEQGHFVLNDDAASTLAQATLQLNGATDKISSTQLTGNHTIGGLTMNGGQLEVEYSSLDHHPTGLLTVNMLDVMGGGNIAITTPSSLPNPLPVTGTSLFDQDDGVFDVIVKATGQVNGVGTQIALTDINGAPVSSGTIVGLVQNGVIAGNAHYNYFGTVKNDGLYTGFGLTQIDAFAGQSVILDNANAIDNALGAKLTGDGGFTLKTTGTVRIGNANSDYTGTTNLNTGNVVLITHNGLGQTSTLNMQSDTGLDFNGNRQVIGSLSAMANSSINLNGGELTITHGGQSDGTLTGQGKLILTSDILSLNQNSSYFTGTTDIQNGATARLTKPQGLGQGVIQVDNGGVLNLDSARGSLLNNLNGQGETVLNNAADIALGGNNADFSGTFITQTGTTLTASEKSQLGTSGINNNGTFVLDTTSLWILDNTVIGSGTFVKKGSGTVQLEASNVSAALTDVQNGLLLIGGSTTRTIPANLSSDVVIRENAALGGYGKVTGNVTNNGNLIVGDALTGAGYGEFIINGNYTGTNTSSLIFNTTLEDDTAATDRLRITGDTAGTGNVVVLNARGEGAQTQNGIKLIDVQGSSNATFILNGRAVAGAYEYFLYQGGVTSPADGHWYLRSLLSNNNKPIYRPEASGYMANMVAAGKLFGLRLEDREGRAENSSMWLRQVGSRNTYRDSSGQLRTRTNSYVVQGGGEVFGTKTSDTGRFGLGVMAAYGKADSKLNSRFISYKAQSRIDGYSLGIYGTWYQNMQTLNGIYVDSWLQYSWLDAKVNGQNMAQESYDMDGFSASIEAGYRLPVYQGLYGNIFITPQSQVIWNGITADDHRERNGTIVSSSGEDNIQTRLGIKLSLDGIDDKDKDADKLFTVYTEANWIHNSKQAGAVLDGIEVKQSGSRNVGELKLGIEGKLNSNLNIWGNLSHQQGGNKYKDSALTLGIKIQF
ncbi:autotransporter outer membrane beta-barrel domain-containing protein [Orbus wheelerorum]|uniref:autotransporter outer membrane beta-barrel domain-containing protein n=1 Tax=Orbus wheelerorum TaxID=3074111 RepID=UPI00370D7CB6